MGLCTRFGLFQGFIDTVCVLGCDWVVDITVHSKLWTVGQCCPPTGWWTSPLGPWGVLLVESPCGDESCGLQFQLPSSSDSLVTWWVVLARDDTLKNTVNYSWPRSLCELKTEIVFQFAKKKISQISRKSLARWCDFHKFRGWRPCFGSASHPETRTIPQAISTWD